MGSTLKHHTFDLSKIRSRAFTEKQATSYGITGWVRNRDDNKVDTMNISDDFVLILILQVEGEAQGDDSALEKLKKDLNQGPKAAKVVKVETKEIPTKEGESSFTS